MGMLSQNIIFVGFMGAGKTTIVRKLARDLGVASVDTDMYIERKYGCSPAAIFKRKGEQAFREMESEALKDCAQLGPILISCGEGVVESKENRELLRQSGYVVHLYSDLDAALSRIKSVRTRPLLKESNNIQELWNERIPVYESVAHATIDVSGCPTSLSVRKIENLLNSEKLYQAK